MCGIIYQKGRVPKIFRRKRMDIQKIKTYIIMTDYVEPNTGKDVSDAIQKVIDENPNRTIYFPDGEYVLAKPIKTSAYPLDSVSFELANYAVLKASDDWSDDEAMVRIGAAEPHNDITTVGSNYCFKGGVVDGNGKAKAIALEGCREALISNVSIKHAKVGIHIKKGVNNGSSDSDVRDVNIVGTDTEDSIGVLIEGADNTLTNMRISSVYTGVKLTRGGNFLRNIHPLYIYVPALEGKYEGSIGFDDVAGGNWFDMCYSDQFATGFAMAPKTPSIYNNCFVFWYEGDHVQTGFHARGKFMSSIKGGRVCFSTYETQNAVLKVDEEGGTGVIEFPAFNPEWSQDKSYEQYLHGRVNAYSKKPLTEVHYEMWKIRAPEEARRVADLERRRAERKNKVQ